MFLLLHFGKGKADVHTSIVKCWKAPLQVQVFLSFEWTVKNVLVYIKKQQHPCYSARGGGGKLRGHIRCSFASSGAGEGQRSWAEQSRAGFGVSGGD